MLFCQHHIPFETKTKKQTKVLSMQDNHSLAGRVKKKKAYVE